MVSDELFKKKKEERKEEKKPHEVALNLIKECGNNLSSCKRP